MNGHGPGWGGALSRQSRPKAHGCDACFCPAAASGDAVRAPAPPLQRTAPARLLLTCVDDVSGVVGGSRDDLRWEAAQQWAGRTLAGGIRSAGGQSFGRQTAAEWTGRQARRQAAHLDAGQALQLHPGPIGGLVVNSVATTAHTGGTTATCVCVWMWVGGWFGSSFESGQRFATTTQPYPSCLTVAFLGLSSP